MNKYTISLGRECPTDSTLLLNDKEYLIESFGWRILSFFADSPNINEYHIQNFLDFIYKNYTDK